MNKPPHFIELGKFHREWGIRGAILGYFYNPHSALIAHLDSLYVRSSGAAPQMTSLKLEAPPTPHQNMFLFKLSGVHTPEAAKHLRGQRFYCPAERIPKPEPGEFYWFEAMGAEVEDDSGEHWGALSRLEGTASNPLLVITAPGGREILYPACPETIHAFDRARARLIIRKIAGLRDGDET